MTERGTPVVVDTAVRVVCCHVHLSMEHAGGALVPCGTKAPKELLHHLPALVLRRPS